MFFWSSLASFVIQRMLAIWSLVPLPFLNPASTSGSLRFTYCWILAWRILSITLLACEMSAITSQSGWNLIFWPDEIIQNTCRNSSYLLVCVCVNPWTIAHQALLSMGFSRQEYWSGLPIPPARDLPNPGIRPAAPTSTGSFFTTEPLGNTYWPLTLRLVLRLGYVSCGYLTAQSPEMNGQCTGCHVIYDSKCC